jgi:hypothetical protein
MVFGGCSSSAAKSRFQEPVPSGAPPPRINTPAQRNIRKFQPVFIALAPKRHHKITLSFPLPKKWRLKQKPFKHFAGWERESFDATLRLRLYGNARLHR